MSVVCGNQIVVGPFVVPELSAIPVGAHVEKPHRLFGYPYQRLTALLTGGKGEDLTTVNPLSSRIGDDRQHLFVGRAIQRRFVNQWLDNPDSVTSVAAITGIGGVGKSALLLHLLQVARNAGVATAWVDGRTCVRTPRGFVESLPPTFARWRRTVAVNPQRLVLGIDNYESVQVLEAWFREIFLPELPEMGVLVLVASRTNLMGRWLVDPGWRQRVNIWTLGPFTPRESLEFLQRQEWPTQDAITAHRLALGHPLSLAVMVEGRRRLGRGPHEMADSVHNTLSADLLREVTDPDLHLLVDALSVLLEANLDLLSRVTQQRIAPAQYRALRALSFVKPTTDGVTLHEIAQKHLFEDFRRRDPSAFESIRQHALTVLMREWDQSDPSRQGAIAQHLLWLCRDVFEGHNSFADLSYNTAELQVTEYRPEDYDDTSEFIANWGRQSFPVTLAQSLALFDVVVHQYPESIRVTRDPQGQPLAVFVALRLYDATLNLLREFHPVFVNRLMAAGLQIHPGPVDEATASLNVLIGIDQTRVDYTPEQILGVVARDQFSFQAGILGLLLLANPNIKQLLALMGYERIPFPVRNDPTLNEELFVLDLRGRHFGRWIRQILAKAGPTPLLPVTAEDVRYFLAHWQDPSALEEAHLAIALRLGTEEVKRRILTLFQAVTPPITLRDRTVFEMSYVNPAGPSWQVAQILHVSRATLYRHQDQAIAHLTQALHFHDAN